MGAVRSAAGGPPIKGVTTLFVTYEGLFAFTMVILEAVSLGITIFVIIKKK